MCLWLVYDLLVCVSEYVRGPTDEFTNNHHDQHLKRSKEDCADNLVESRSANIS